VKSTKFKVTEKGLAFLKRIAKWGGVGVGGAYDDYRVAKPLHRDGLIEMGNLGSGTSEWRLADAGRLLLRDWAIAELEDLRARELGRGLSMDEKRVRMALMGVVMQMTPEQAATWEQIRDYSGGVTP
jgi:hypothetical protein